MNSELLTIIENLEKSKGIDREVLIQAIEGALLSASKKQLGHYPDLRFLIDRETGKIRAFAKKEVTEEVSNPVTQISPEHARQANDSATVGENCEVEVPLENFGRIAAQTAKQTIIQKIRQAEREAIYKEYENRLGDIVSGIVRRVERGNIIVDLGKTEAILPHRERVPGEEFLVGHSLRGYIIDVRKGDMPAQIVISRRHSGMVRKLFEFEIPEIYEGTVQIKSIAREPGVRSKIAVASLIENVDPVGTCVGIRGSRIRNIVRELREEKIDIVPWSNDTQTFITNALSPAKVREVRINENRKTADVIVEDDQLSLAIGKRGQNVRLSAKLTEWKINVRTSAQFRAENSATVLEQLPGVGIKLAWDLVQAGFNSIEGIANADIEDLKPVPGVGPKTAEKLIAAAKEIESQ